MRLAVFVAIVVLVAGIVAITASPWESGDSEGRDEANSAGGEARLGGVASPGVGPITTSSSPCDNPPWAAGVLIAPEVDSLQQWDALPYECREDYPMAWAREALAESCTSPSTPSGQAVSLALSLLDRLVQERGATGEDVSPPSLEPDEFSCLLRLAAHADEGGAEVTAQALLNRFSSVKTETTDPALVASLREVAAVVEQDTEWWRRFWLALPRKKPFPIRYSLCNAIAAELGWQGLYHVLVDVSGTEDLMAHGGASALALYGRYFMRTLQVESVDAAFFVPKAAKMRIVMLHAVPTAARWPFRQLPPLGRGECARGIQAHLDALGTEPAPAEDVWRLGIIRNQLALQGPTVVLGELAQLDGVGVGDSEEAQLRVGLGLRWLDEFDRFEQVPGVSEQGAELQRVLVRILQATSEADLAALVVLMSRQGLFRPTDGTARERLLGMVAEEQIERLPTAAREALGL